MTNVKKRIMTEQTKTCTKCGETKGVSEFHKNKAGKYGVSPWCKVCMAQHQAKYRAKPEVKEAARQHQAKYRAKPEVKEAASQYYTKYRAKPEFKEARRQYYAKHRAKPEVKEAIRQYYTKHQAKPEVKEAIRQYYAKPEVKEARRQYYAKPEVKEARRQCYAKYQAKPEVKEARRQLHKTRFLTDPLYRLTCNIRSNIRSCFQRRSLKKNSRTYQIIGCDFDFLKQHLESQFTDGMTWDNMGEWHVDHILPNAIARTEEEVIAFNHYCNLQPLWAEDNLAKSDKITQETEKIHQLYVANIAKGQIPLNALKLAHQEKLEPCYS